MVMACGVNYPYIHSNNFEMNRFFFLLIRFEVNQPSHWLFTKVAKVAHEQFKWGFPYAGDSQCCFLTRVVTRRALTVY